MCGFLSGRSAFRPLFWFPLRPPSRPTDIFQSQVSIIELRDKYQRYVCNVDEHVNESIMYSARLFVFVFELL